MQSMTSVDLAFSWPDAPRYLPRRWITVLGPYVDQEQSSILSARLVFPDADQILQDFLAFAETKMAREPRYDGILGRLGLRGQSVPLLRAVRRWNQYGFVDLQGRAVVQLLLDKTIALKPPLNQYYRVEIEPALDCPQCGQVLLRQLNPLVVRGRAGSESDLRGHAWQPSDDVAATENHEIIISQRLRHLWETAAAPDHPQFLAVEIDDASQPLWQVTPQGTVHVLAPPTPLQVRDRCPACGRPLTAALSTSPSDDLFGPDRGVVYEQEALLTLDNVPLPAGDLWVTDVQEGRIRELREVLRGFEDYPDPFYIRSSRPFWLISQRLLRVLHDHVAGGWRCQLVNGLD